MTKKRNIIIFALVLIVTAGAAAGAYALYANKQDENTTILSYDEGTESQEKNADTATAIDLTKIPVGDGKVSNAAKVGYTYACNTNFRQGGARHAGDWLNEANGTWDATTKVSVKGSVLWPNAEHTISTSGDTRTLHTNGLPQNQATGIFPITRDDPAYEFDTNPNPIAIQNVSYTVPLNPTPAATPGCTTLGPIGVMNDGVILFNSLDDAGLDAAAHETQDACNGHPNGKDMYHYHDVSSCTLQKTTASSTLVGYALDGYGIYIERDADGNLPTNADLDECHGRVSQVEWNGTKQEIYHYVATHEYPYTVGCFHGTSVGGQNNGGTSLTGPQQNRAR